MRRIRARRRFKLALTLALVICIMVFAENRIEALVPQVKNFAQIKLGESLGVGSALSIGSIEGGIFHPIILNDIKIINGKGVMLASSVDIDSVKTNYRIWDVLFKIGNESVVSIDFTMRNKYLCGHATIRGGINDAEISGVIETPCFGEVLFNGSVRASSFDMAFESQKGIVRASGFLPDDSSLLVDFKAEHLKIGIFDIVCDGRSNISMAEGRLRGEFETKNTILNYRPFPNLKICYSAAGGNLNINDARIGDMFRLAGRMLLSYPNNMEMALEANNVSLSWLFIALGAKDASEILNGTMNGKFEFRGPADRLKTVARVDIRKGTMGELDFEALSATLKGDLPYLRIEDARITRQSGYFTLEGEMDMRRLGKNTFFDNVKLTSDDKAINWDGWKSAKVKNVQEIKMKKRLNDDININFKKFVADEKVDESIQDRDEVGLEYKLHPNDSLKMIVGRDKNFLGLEHKDKF